MVYKVDQAYAPEFEGQINALDSSLAIDWPFFDKITISEKDKNAMTFEKFRTTYGGIDL